MQEEFKYHKSGYLVSNLGRIKGKRVEFVKLTNIYGYYMCSFGLVHRIVYETFKGNILDGYEIHHKDHNKLNNCINNLEMVTKSQNQKYNHIHKDTKNKIKGENNPNSLLTEKEVIEIYELIKKGETNIEIANKYNLTHNYIYYLRTGKRWNHLYKKYFNIDDSYPSLGNCILPLELMIQLLDDIVKFKKSNIEISDKYGLDKTMISRIRNKKRWSDIWKHYYKYHF